ncbi:MAG: metallophosphoesterase [Pseudomonadota bacterium]
MKILQKILSSGSSQGGRATRPPGPAASTPFPQPAPEVPLCVIGDVHGRSDLLGQLGAQLEQAWDLSAQGYQIVFVGDYIDRGDDSRRVLEWLFEACQQGQGVDRPVTLMGNHEEMLLDFLDAPRSAGRRWLQYGGLQTLASFGVGGITQTARGDALAEAAASLSAAMPEGMEDWLRAMPRQWSTGNVHVVHAAADPRLPMTAQPPEVLIWGLSDFATHPRGDGQWVVHGHTITQTPGPDAQGRIPIDTGAYYSGQLTAVGITPDGTISLLST